MAKKSGAAPLSSIQLSAAMPAQEGAMRGFPRYATSKATIDNRAATRKARQEREEAKRRKMEKGAAVGAAEDETNGAMDGQRRVGVGRSLNAWVLGKLSSKNK